MGLLEKIQSSRRTSHRRDIYSKYVSTNAPREQIISFLSSELNKSPKDIELLYYMMSEVVASHDMTECKALFTHIEKLDLSIELRQARLLKYCLDDQLLFTPYLLQRQPGSIIEDHRLTPPEGVEPEYITTSQEFVQYFLKMKLFSIVRENMCFQDPVNRFLLPVEHIKFIFQLNDQYSTESNAMNFLYLQGYLAIEWYLPAYGLQLLNEYISLTKDDSDINNHNKYYSRGIAYLQLHKYQAAIPDFEKSLKFTDNEKLIEEEKIEFNIVEEIFRHSY